MPFETVLTDGADRARLTRLSQIVLSVFALYVALVGFAMVMSGWRVDELSAPLRSVAIFQPAVLRTPHPLAAGAKTVAAKATKTTRVTQRRSVVAPASHPVVATTVSTSVAAEGSDSPSKTAAPGSAETGGSGSGDDGPGTGHPGALDGDGEPTAVPPRIGAQQCLHCPTPHVPPHLLQVASTLTLAARICVDKKGEVTSVDIRQGVSETVDVGVANTVRGWRFSPITVNGNPVPFCYPAVFVWKAA